MRLLLAAGADPIGAGDLDDMGVIGWATVLQAAPDEPQVAFEQRRLAVELLLQQGAKHTIWSAIAVGDVEVIGAIVEGESATLHARMSQFGRHRSPLHVAVAGTGRPQSGPFEDVVRLLLEFGARLDVEDDDGLTPLDVAALGEGVDLTSMLLDAGARLTLPAALCLGRADDITYLAKQEVDALRRGGRYATLIDQAATRATGEQIQLLIDNGADVHAGYPEERDWTPLHTAALQNNRSAAEVLVSNGADLTALDKAYQSTPMGHAAHGGHDELANWLRDQHTDQEAASTSSQSGDRRHVP
jgi:ankyrin repeat protein